MTALDRAIDSRDLRGRMIFMLAAIVFASVVALGFTVVAAFDRAVEPELTKRTRLIGGFIRSEIQRALDLGIPIDAVPGLDQYISKTIEKFEEVESIVVTTLAGNEIASAKRPVTRSLFEMTGLGEVIEFKRNAFSLPILEGNSLVGNVEIETSPVFVQTRLRKVFLDVLVLGLVAVLIALELSVAIAVASFGKPLDCINRLLSEQCSGDYVHRIRVAGVGKIRQLAIRLNDHAEDLATRWASISVESRARVNARIANVRPLLLRLSDLNDIRLALFLFSTATEISSAFLPIFASTATRPEWLESEIAAALPLVVYLVALTIITPFGGSTARWIGPRRLFLVSILPTVVALSAMAMSSNVLGITIWRGVIAVFYATATIACQEYAIKAQEDRSPRRSVGAFVAVVYGGVFCGSALGGLLAGRFGFGTALLFGAGLAAVSGMVGMNSMRGSAGDRAARAQAEVPVHADRGSGPGGRLVTLLVGIAMPMNAATAIVIWYLVPLSLSAAGSDPAEIGRVVMLYYLAIVAFGPAIARLADGRIGETALVMVGAFGSAGAMLSLYMWSGLWMVVVLASLLGLGHTFIRAPLYSLIAEFGGGRGRGIDVLRFLERVGPVVGLIAIASFLGEIDENAVAIGIRAVGVVTLFGALAFTIVEVRHRIRDI